MSTARLQRPRDATRPRRRLAATALLLAALVAAGTALAGAPAPRTPELTEVAKVRLVLLPATVTTPRGKPVRDLESEDFRLFEDGRPQAIDLFATERDASIALAFLLDVSGSMRLRDRLGEAKLAIRRIVDSLDEEDRVALLTFAEGRVEWAAGFDASRAELDRRLRSLKPSGRTALYDALAASPDAVERSVQGRKAIVLITDGVDNASDQTRLRATWMARRVPVPIYTLGFIPASQELLPRRAREALRVVERFSTETGGTLFPVYASADLERAVERIEQELRFQYVIGFYPSGEDLDGSFRRLRLTTTRDELRVRTRRGYYANP